ncbi:MAG: GNAT family N-acetyltransferase [Pseudomonadota bacterium]|nr:GNAT family N-acetyltransferase [Pseudomonadota bacterium]
MSSPSDRSDRALGFHTFSRFALMPNTEFTVADLRLHRVPLVELNVEYVTWVLDEIDKWFGIPAGQVLGMPAREYVPTVIDKVCGESPPKGRFYLVTVGGRLAAMGGLRSLGGDAVELKRIYVRPECRAMGIGATILDRLLADARDFGYARACLDSGPFMRSAHRLYEHAGFVDRSPYEGVEVPVEFHPQWRFMQRPL